MSIVRPLRKDHDPQACYICGMPADHTHHCWHGVANRRLSEADGLTVRLCWQCHRALHDEGRFDRELMRYAEWDWIRYYGKTEQDFIARYGRSVIDGRIDPREE